MGQEVNVWLSAALPQADGQIIEISQQNSLILVLTT